MEIGEQLRSFKEKVAQRKNSQKSKLGDRDILSKYLVGCSPREASRDVIPPTHMPVAHYQTVASLFCTSYHDATYLLMRSQLMQPFHGS